MEHDSTSKHHFTEKRWPNLGKPRNIDRRGREYLTPQEIDQVIAAAGRIARHGHRDATMILVAYRHSLRVSELVALRWDQVDLKNGRLHVRRRKNGLPSTHPLYGPELRALRRLLREHSDTQYVFVSQRKAPMTTSTFSKIIARAATISSDAARIWRVATMRSRLARRCGSTQF